MYEVLNYYKPKIEASTVLQDLSLDRIGTRYEVRGAGKTFTDTSEDKAVTNHQSPGRALRNPAVRDFSEGASLQGGISHQSPITNNYFLVSTHREENVDNPGNLIKILTVLNKLAEIYGFPVVVSTHPRTRKRLEKIKDIKMNPLIQFLKPFGFLDYVKLQMNALCTLSDSGTISEESAILHFPAVSIRQSMERPEAQDAGTIILTGFDPDVVLASIDLAIKEHNLNVPKLISPDYLVPDTSWRVLKLIQGLSSLSNKWHGIQ
jgi:UDP-N-acetylglucosamine 2-epimerase